MDEADDFERAMLASPFDDALRHMYGNWFEERRDSRGKFLRAWFALHEASQAFEMALSHWAKIDNPFYDRYVVDDAFAFWDAAGHYQRLAQTMDRDWLWRLGAVRPWLDQNLGLLVAKCIVWEGGLDPRFLVEESSTKPERAWVFCYDGPDAPSRVGSKDCPPKDFPTWYLLHKFLGTFVDVCPHDPTLAMQDLERRL